MRGYFRLFLWNMRNEIVATTGTRRVAKAEGFRPALDARDGEMGRRGSAALPFVDAVLPGRLGRKTLGGKGFT